MTASDPSRVDAGALVLTLPRTMSPRNWPFTLLGLSAAVLFATPLALDGKWAAAALMAGVIVVVPVLVGVRQLLEERRGLRELAAIHEHGVIWRRLGTTGFLPWSEVQGVTARRLDEDDPHTLVYEVTLHGGAPALRIDEGADGEAARRELERRLAR
jgi:hypothetical protein